VKKLLLLMLLMILSVISCSSNPTKNQIQAKKNRINGHAAECMMDVFFTHNQNWQKIEGENGIHGIDGLYIKYKNDNISDVLVAESKWNTSRLGTTKKGTIKQMSKRWILDKLKEAKPHNPHVKNYDQISTLVKKGIYRARLFKLKPYLNNKLKITLYRIKNKSDGKSIEKVDKSEIVIDMKNPENVFHERMLGVYNHCKKND